MTTRLERHMQEQSRKKALLLALVIVVIVAFFLTVGVPLFVSLSGRVSDYLAGETVAEEESDDLEFSDVEIDAIPEATNSASIELSGTVASVDRLSVYLNGKVIQRLNVEGKSEFITEIEGLDAGTNEVYISGERKGSTNIRRSSKHTVLFNADKPTLEISEPTDGSNTPREEITVVGKTNPGSGNQVRVNGAPTVIAADGSFRWPVRLREGENKILVRVEDNAGNFEEKTVTVKYEK